ncbi:DNA sulfur modification protein DndB [Serratia liquefaciens]|uniref:DNA sulfur modification protein DndB n=1 Tax=Serratia liquefaciens TaxID=614 RepID=UPI0022DD3C2C|nr:DNA sulfur modification protein DndB [Serratia liquefaciens]WBL72394.1 DNA sulfur modification protein DndB [Serratia liquefaciens]
MTDDVLPQPLTGLLDDLLVVSSGAEKDYNVFIGHNLGERVFLLSVPMRGFYEMSEVANEQYREGIEVTQRKLDQTHANKLALYILKGLVSSAITFRENTGKPSIKSLLDIQENLGKQPYLALQPIVTNVRDIGLKGNKLRAERLLSTSDNKTACFKVYLAQNNILWVVDGQHRREGMKIAFEFIEQLLRTHSYPKKKGVYSPPDEHLDLSSGEIAAWNAILEASSAFSTVTVEMHLGLDIDQERQLFHDLNNLGKKIDKNLALKFDSANPINSFIKGKLIDELDIKVTDIEQKDWSKDDGSILLKDITAVNAILFLNKTNISTATPDVKDKFVVATKFWSSVQAIDGFGQEKGKERTVALQPVVLKALAKLAFDFNFSKRKASNSDELYETLLDGISNLDFSHQNNIWQYYSLPENERESLFPGLSEYLPDSASGNRDIGSMQGGVMRFGAKHNDIYPIIGDMIRYMLKLPNRHQ